MIWEIQQKSIKFHRFSVLATQKTRLKHNFPHQMHKFRFLSTKIVESITFQSVSSMYSTPIDRIKSISPFFPRFRQVFAQISERERRHQRPIQFIRRPAVVSLPEATADRPPCPRQPTVDPVDIGDVQQRVHDEELLFCRRFGPVRRFRIGRSPRLSVADSAGWRRWKAVSGVERPQVGRQSRPIQSTIVFIGLQRCRKDGQGILIDVLWHF